MSVPLPLVTRREIFREFRPDETVTIDSGIRSLREKHALSAGLSFVPRGVGGEVGGRVHLYSALNRDAARAARRKDFVAARRISNAAAQLERSPEAKSIVAALAATAGLSPISGAAELARALSVAGVAEHVARLQRKMTRAHGRLSFAGAPTVLNGHVATITDAVAILKLHGSLDFPVPRTMLEDAQLHEIGAPVSAVWELLPGGRTLLTVEPAVDAPSLNELDEPLVDIYGTPWGSVLASVNPEALEVTGTPTIAIPKGIPEIE